MTFHLGEIASLCCFSLFLKMTLVYSPKTKPKTTGSPRNAHFIGKNFSIIGSRFHTKTNRCSCFVRRVVEDGYVDLRRLIDGAQGRAT